MPKEILMTNFYFLTLTRGLIVCAVLIMFTASTRGPASREFKERILRQCEKLAFLGLTFSLLYSTLHFFKMKAPLALFENAVYFDSYTAFAGIFLSLMGLLTIILADRELFSDPMNIGGEFYSMLLFAVCGAIMMAASADLIVTIIAMEILSFSTYIMVAMDTKNRRAVEGIFKYFLMGATASALFLFGMAHIYGSTGTTSLHGIAAALKNSSIVNSHFMTIIIGTGFITVALLFKAAAVPFHMWAPDAYDGAGISTAAFMTYFVKAAIFIAAYRIFSTAFSNFMPFIKDGLIFISIITMTFANIAALRQSNLKRMLAYSSISHTGYLLIAIISISGAGIVYEGNAGAYILFYLLVYFFTNIAIFAAINAVIPKTPGVTTIRDLRGIGFKRPYFAAAFSLGLFSLAGIPATGGFMAKFFIFYDAFLSNNMHLVIFAVINSLIAMYYYIKVIAEMYMEKPENSEGPDFFGDMPDSYCALTLSASMILLTAIFPDFFLNLAKSAISGMFRF